MQTIDEDSIKKANQKKDYHHPNLSIYGSIQQLTQTSGSFGAEDTRVTMSQTGGT